MPFSQLHPDDPVLVLDDEFLVLWMLQDALEQIGLRNIHTASSQEAALALLEKQKFCFGFLDVNLGAGKSFSLAATLQERNVPFAFVTGYGRAGLEGQFAETPVLAKPLEPRMLRSLLNVAP